MLVDRTDRKRLMVMGQFGRALLVAALIALILSDALSIWLLLVVALGLGVGEVIVDTTSQAAIPQLVERDQLDRANSRLTAATQVLDEVVGVALGAVLFARAVSAPFVVDAATFLLGGILLSSVRRPLQGARTTRASVRADLSEGFRFLRNHAFLRSLMFGAAVSNLATNMSFAVLVVLVVTRLGASEEAFGVVVAVAAVGGVLAALIAAWVSEHAGRTRVLVGAPLVMAAGLALTAYGPNVAVVAAGWFVIRFGIISVSVPAVSLRQAMTPEHLLGRVVATFRMIGIGASPLGALLGGVLTKLTDVRTTNLVATVLMLTAAVVMLSAVRHLVENEAVPAG